MATTKLKVAFVAHVIDLLGSADLEDPCSFGGSELEQMGGMPSPIREGCYVALERSA